MALEVEGILLKKFDTQQINETFRKREFVVQIGDRYPQPVKFDLTQDRCILIDNYEEGQAIKVHFDLRGREWQGRYFVDLSAWRLERPGAATAPATNQQADPSSSPTGNANSTQSNAPAGNEDDDDLPF